jgi:hypothetical protein
MTTRVLSALIVIALFPQSAAEEPASFELRWSRSGFASVKIDPGIDDGIVVSSPQTIEDASVPLSQIFCIQKDEDSRARCLSQDFTDTVRVLALKWIYVDGTRHLFIAWSPLHTCEADEPTHYFKVVDGADFSRQLGFAAKVWRQSNSYKAPLRQDE